jgi:hypothetical protein
MTGREVEVTSPLTISSTLQLNCTFGGSEVNTIGELLDVTV